MRIVPWLIFVGCAGDSLSFEADIQPEFDVHCVSCHNPNLAESDLDLMTDPYEALVEQAAVQSDYLLVSPKNPLESYLWHKLNGTQSLAGGAGTRMPLDDAFQQDLTDLVEDWINDGAKP